MTETIDKIVVHTSNRDIFLAALGTKLAGGLKDIKFFSGNVFDVAEEDLYAELNRMESAHDQPDKEVLGRRSPA